MLLCRKSTIKVRPWPFPKVRWEGSGRYLQPMCCVNGRSFSKKLVIFSKHYQTGFGKAIVDIGYCVLYAQNVMEKRKRPVFCWFLGFYGRSRICYRSHGDWFFCNKRPPKRTPYRWQRRSATCRFRGLLPPLYSQSRYALLASTTVVFFLAITGCKNTCFPIHPLLITAVWNIDFFQKHGPMWNLSKLS